MSKFEDEGIDFDNFDLEAELAKFKGLKPKGWDVIVRLFMPSKVIGKLEVPDTYHHDQQYSGCAGLVVAVSPDAYKDARYEGMAPWCEVGKWHMFPKHSGTRYIYKGIPTYVLKEDGIGPEVDDPRDVSR